MQDLEADLPSLSDEDAVRRYCRKHAEGMEAGLVEATTTTSLKGPAIKLIFKKLQKPAFKFTGQLITPLPNAECIWTIVAREQGTTGIREALITSDLMKKGKLTLESYKASWAQDPYDSSYCGVDRSTLRYMSDDEAYDHLFPQHPLSKVRRELYRHSSMEIDNYWPPPHPARRKLGDKEKLQGEWAAVKETFALPLGRITGMA